MPREEVDGPEVHAGTIHAAKGLEWDQVFVLAAHEGHFPNLRAGIEEERRLAYVAITRAREAAYLLLCAEVEKAPTRFATETHRS